jgi:hypothetical protein
VKLFVKVVISPKIRVGAGDGKILKSGSRLAAPLNEAIDMMIFTIH